jgi:spore coat protein CotH
MLDNATKEEYIKVDVVINGTTFSNVGIRPKGNSSLRQVASSESDRYSFRIKFDEYVKGQTCFGLDNLVVNNMFGDNTYMKHSCNA